MSIGAPRQVTGLQFCTHKSCSSFPRIVYRGTFLFALNVRWYTCTHMANRKMNKELVVERVQTGIRMERRVLKVLKATAELKDMSVGDLLEGIVLHAFEGKSPFSRETLKLIAEFRAIYGLSLRAADSHNLKERKKRPARDA